jgi:hypothetical protein
MSNYYLYEPVVTHMVHKNILKKEEGFLQDFLHRAKGSPLHKTFIILLESEPCKKFTQNF